jgi:DinB family protein
VVPAVDRLASIGRDRFLPEKLMDPRIEVAITDLEEGNRDLLDFLASLTDQQWRAVSEEERWPVRAVAYHIADGFRIHMLWIEHLRLRQPVPGTPEQSDEENARTAGESAAMSPLTIRAAARTAGRLIVAYLGELRSEELGRSASHGPLGGREVGVQEMLEIAPCHVREHLKSMNAAVSRLGASQT